MESDEDTMRDVELDVFVICKEGGKKCCDVELLCVCDFCHKLVSHGQPVRGVHHPSQICDKNHKFVTSLARFSVFCVEFSDNFCATKTQKEFWDRSIYFLFVNISKTLCT